MISLENSFVTRFIAEEHIKRLENQARLAHGELWESTVHQEFKGWLNWPVENHEDLLAQIEEITCKFRTISSVVVVVGIGGSYLGAKSAISLMKSQFSYAIADEMQIVFAGHQLSPTYMSQLLEFLNQHEVTLVVISKSGSTLEPSASFHILREYLEKRYGIKAHERICAVTDPDRGILRTYATDKKYHALPIPPNIGGRYSVLTAVGLLPMQLAGIDIRKVLEGAKWAHNAYQGSSIANPALRYALYRHILYQKGFAIEALVTYEPHISDFARWWQQLFGESQGKDGMGLFPTMLEYTTDLHSMGQYVQDARNMMFETVLDISTNSPPVSNVVPETTDGVNLHLAGRSLAYIQQVAIESVMRVHSDGGVPNIGLHASGNHAELFGELAFFFETACALGGYLLGIHPFNQPGVEGYKIEIMRRLQ